MHSIIIVESGGLILRGCLLSLRYFFSSKYNQIFYRSLPRNLRPKIPSLVALPGTKINIVGCEFTGNDCDITAGCLFINADVVMSSCRFHNFKGGAIFTVS